MCQNTNPILISLEESNIASGHVFHKIAAKTLFKMNQTLTWNVPEINKQNATKTPDSYSWNLLSVLICLIVAVDKQHYV
jgi:hypothetical protein